TMTPESIVDTALKDGLGLISITDHNSIGNVEAAIAYADAKDIVVVPGVELSTPQGHLLIYVPDFHALERLYGRLNISEDKKVCNQTIEQCLDLAKEFSGFGIAAHIDLDTGLEGMMTRFDPFKERVFTHEALLGLEISNAGAASWYTQDDDNQDRRR